MSQTSSVERYVKIIQQMEEFYLSNETDSSLIDRFRRKLGAEFKLEITYDSDLGQALRQYYRKINDELAGTDSFSRKLRYIYKIASLFFSAGFLNKRDNNHLNAAIEHQLKSPSNKWLDEMAYLKNAENREEFRYEFLIRIMGIDEQSIEELVNDPESEQSKEEMKKYYESFFKQCIKENSNPKIVNFIEDYIGQWENKSEILSPEMIKAVEKKLGASVGSDDKEIHLNKMLVEIAQDNAYQNDQQAQQRFEDEVKIIEKALQKFSGLNIITEKKLVLRLGRFGSLTSGFAGIDADLDLTILTNSYVNEIELLKLLHEFLRKDYKEENRKGGRRIDLELITTAKTPLIAISIKERGESDIKVDIIVNNILGIINSRFLKAYSGVRWVKNLGLLVKLWGKSCSLISKSNLSSYAMVLMLIYYLIRERKVQPLMDARVQTREMPHFRYKRTKVGETEQFDVYYSFKTASTEVSSYQRINYMKTLYGFMKFYAEDLWKLPQQERIITVDQSKDRPIDFECCITIKDPFDQPHNPGRMRADSKDYFIQKFKDALEVLRGRNEERIRNLFITK